MSEREGTPASSTGKITILLVDPHAVFRAGLRLLINAERDLEVVGEAGDSASAIRVASEEKPNVAVVDLALRGASGLEFAEAIQRVSPKTRILVLTAHDDVSYARTAIARGVGGYLVKDIEAPDFLSAIRAVHRGRLYIHLGSRADVSEITEEAVPSPTSGHARLSAREHRVLVLVARGYTSREIGRMLAVSPKTAETYRARIAAKLGLRTRADLVRFALESRLLTQQTDPAVGSLSL